MEAIVYIYSITSYGAFIVFMNKYAMSDCKPKLSSAVILGVDEISLCFSGLGNHSHENCP